MSRLQAEISNNPAVVPPSGGLVTNVAMDQYILMYILMYSTIYSAHSTLQLTQTNHMADKQCCPYTCDMVRVEGNLCFEHITEFLNVVLMV